MKFQHFAVFLINFNQLSGAQLMNTGRNIQQLGTSIYLHSWIISSNIEEPLFVNGKESSSNCRGWKTPGRIPQASGNVLGREPFPEKVQVPVKSTWKIVRILNVLKRHTTHLSAGVSSLHCYFLRIICSILPCEAYFKREMHSLTI